MCQMRLDCLLFLLIATQDGLLPHAGPGYPDFNGFFDTLRPGFLDSDLPLDELLGCTLCVTCCLCGECIAVWESSEAVAADDLPDGPVWNRIWAAMARHWFETHGCKLSRNLGRPALCGPLQCPTFGRPSSEPCAINSGHAAHGTTQMEISRTIEVVCQRSNGLNWFDFFRLARAIYEDGVWMAPHPSNTENDRIEACKKLCELFTIRHALECQRSIFNVIYSRLVFDIPTMLSRVYWTLRLTTTPPCDGGTGSVRLPDVLYWIFTYLIESEVQTIAGAHNTEPDVVFGQLYLWLLHDTPGRNPIDLNMRQLLEIAVGQYCKMQFDNLHKLRVEALLQMQTELLHPQQVPHASDPGFLDDLDMDID